MDKKKQKSGFSHSKWEKPNKRKKRNYQGIGSKTEVVKKCKMRWEQLQPERLIQFVWPQEATVTGSMDWGVIWVENKRPN